MTGAAGARGACVCGAWAAGAGETGAARGGGAAGRGGGPRARTRQRRRQRREVVDPILVEVGAAAAQGARPSPVERQRGVEHRRCGLGAERERGAAAGADRASRPSTPCGSAGRAPLEAKGHRVRGQGTDLSRAGGASEGRSPQVAEGRLQQRDRHHAAVSARSILGPRETLRAPAASQAATSSPVRPPSGPTTAATPTGCGPAPRGSPPGWKAKRAKPAGIAARAAASGQGGWATAGTSARPHCRAASAAILRQRTARASPRSRSRRTTDRSAANGQDRRSRPARSPSAPPDPSSRPWPGRPEQPERERRPGLAPGPEPRAPRSPASSRAG